MVNNNHPWRTIYNLFNPMQKLEGETLKYFVSRDPTLLDNMATELGFSTENYHTLFVGQRGSGKSSELRRLADRVGSQFFTVLIDVDELTDLFSVNHVEVLYLMGATIYGAGIARGLRIDKGLLNDLVNSIQTLVREQTNKKDFTIDIQTLVEAITTGAAVAVGGPVGAVMIAAVNLFKGIKFSLGVSDSVVRKLEVKPQVTTIVQALNQLIAAVEAESSQSLLVIVDGLDRVEFEQGRAVFAESQILSQPDCHLIYVIPAHLYYSPQLILAKQIFRKVYLLPNIKLHEPGTDTPFVAGYELMQTVVERRLQETAYTRPQLFADDALELLIKMSGGLMREFIRLVQSAVLNAATGQAAKVEMSAAEAAVDALRRDYMAGMTDPLLEELVKLAETGLPTGTDAGNMLLQSSFILAQSNRELWYEVHPVLAPFVEQERLKRRPA